MRIIFSRKGFDSTKTNGRVPSPIFPPDDRLQSVPIPFQRGRPLSSCYAGPPTLASVMHDLTRGRINGETTIHLDPDVTKTALERSESWLPAFGQDSHTQTFLANQHVGVDDVFLFFGWFRRVELKEDGHWRRVREAPDIHCLFGWLQIGEVVGVPADVAKALEGRAWLADHPHLDPEYAKEFAARKNTVYIASSRVSLDGESLGIAGGGVFPRWTPSLQLTARDQRRSLWRLPGWMAPRGSQCALSHHSNLGRWKRDGDDVLLQTVGIGQEFVLDAANYHPEALQWLRTLLEEHAPKLSETVETGPTLPTRASLDVRRL